MNELIRKYTEFLANHPEAVISIQVFTVVMVCYYIVLFMYRKVMIEGSKGTNGILEVSEQYSYMGLWFIPPVVVFSGIFKYDLPTPMWYFIGAYVAFVLGGRWLFMWALAWKAGKTEVTETKTTVKEETTVTESK